MQHMKCKNAVFSALFFLFFSLGTICGAFLLQMISQEDGGWIRAYCTALSQAEALSPWAALFVLVRPILLVLAAGMVPGGYRLLPVLIFLRGCLTAYAAAACFVTGMSPAFVILRGLLLLPFFYFFCRWVYGMQTRDLTAGQAKTQ